MNLSTDIERMLRNRRGLLWVCQRYDLSEGESPHHFDGSIADAAAKYRLHMRDTDIGLSDFYWREAWFEGAKSQLLDNIRAKASNMAPESRRGVVLLVSEEDADAIIEADEFFPISVLPGQIGENVPIPNRYGQAKAKKRERIAFELAGRLRLYSGYVLVVVGARTEGDLTFLGEVLEELLLPHMTILLVWPGSSPIPSSLKGLQYSCHIWNEEETSLIDALQAAGAVSYQETPDLSIRLGKSSHNLPAKTLRGIDEYCHIIWERDLFAPQRFEMDDLLAFFNADLDNWKAYNIGLPVARSHAASDGSSIEGVVLTELNNLRDAKGGTTSATIEIPCETGSGITTTMRGVAHRAASEGYPTLILRPNATRIDPDTLSGFLTTLTETGGLKSEEPLPPALIVLDVEHEALREARQIGHSLRSAGRRAVILRAVRYEESKVEIRTTSFVRLPPLRARTDSAEIRSCHGVLSKIQADWKLPLEIPDIVTWESYADNSIWSSPDSLEASESLFWVALRYFLTKELEFSTAEQFHDALGRWLKDRIESIPNNQILSVLDYVAVLSSFRILSPLWTVLRPVYGGEINTELTSALRHLDGITEWAPYQKSLDDNVVRFLHPALAIEYLRQKGLRSQFERLQLLRNVLYSMSPGHAGDRWLAETLSSIVIVPPHEERAHVDDWEWRLDTFSSFPLPLSQQSKTILHHWARCLYLSVHQLKKTDGSSDECIRRFNMATLHLERAIELPDIYGLGEHPSHLYNTLGTAYARKAEYLESELGDTEGGGLAWEQAHSAFQRAINLLGGQNVEALLALSKRLIKRVDSRKNRPDADNSSLIADAAESLSLLSQAEEVLDNNPDDPSDRRVTIATDRTSILAFLDSHALAGYLDHLKNKVDPDLGFYCEAQLLLRSSNSSADAVRSAIAKLEEARACDVKFSARTLMFWIGLMRLDKAERHKFEELRKLHLQLERIGERLLRPIDKFRHAVVCYQVGAFEEGAERFRKLREQLRRPDSPSISEREFWREPKASTRPRQTSIRITRVQSDWRAYGFVEEIGQNIPLRPRHFRVLPRENQILTCILRFTQNGPLAVPPEFELSGKSNTRDR